MLKQLEHINKSVGLSIMMRKYYSKIIEDSLHILVFVALLEVPEFQEIIQRFE